MIKSLGVIAGIACLMTLSVSFAADVSEKDAWTSWLGKQESSTTLKARWSADQSRLQHVGGVLIPAADARSLERRVSDLATEIRVLQGMDVAELSAVRKSGTLTRKSYRYEQQYEGLPVEGHDLVINVRGDGAVVGFQNNLKTFLKPATLVNLTPKRAHELALDALEQGLSPAAGAKVEPTLVVLPVFETPVRVWKVPVTALPHGFYTIYVRADDGKVLWVRNQMIR